MQAEQYREKLLKELAETDFARRVASGEDAVSLARRLGVAEETLVAAARCAKDAAAFQHHQIDIFAPHPVAVPLVGLSHELAMGHHQLMLAVLHAVLQTEREPSPRARGHWEPLPGHKEARHRLVVAAKGALAVKRDLHLKTVLSAGLSRALDRRAASFGVRRSRYVLLWLADLVDGRLSDVPVGPVDVPDLFPDEKKYVLTVP